MQCIYFSANNNSELVDMYNLIDSTNYLLDHIPQISNTSFFSYKLSSEFAEIDDGGEVFDPARSIAFEFDQMQINSLNIFSRFKNRIKLLREQAHSEDYLMNSESESTFWTFFERISKLKYGCLFLLENGNLQATWNDDKKNHIGLEFVNRQAIGFVIFKSRNSSEPVSRLSGIDTMNGLEDLISVYGLKKLLIT